MATFVQLRNVMTSCMAILINDWLGCKFNVNSLFHVAVLADACDDVTVRDGRIVAGGSTSTSMRASRCGMSKALHMEFMCTPSTGSDGPNMAWTPF